MSISFCFVLQYMQISNQNNKNWNSESLARETVSKYSTCVYLFGWKILCSIKLMSMRGNPRDVTEEPYRKTTYTWLNIWFWTHWTLSGLQYRLKLGDAEVASLTSVSVSLIDKYRLWRIMDNNDLISYIMSLTGVTCQALINSMQ